MKFFTTSVTVTDRVTKEENPLNIEVKHEDIILEVRLTSSGNTSTFTNNQLENIILEILKEIEPKN